MELQAPKKIEDCKTVVDFAYRNRYKQLTYGQEFLQVFGQSLKNFWDGNIFGFDVIRFDEWLGTPDGTSTNQHIINKYGLKAKELVDNLV